MKSLLIALCGFIFSSLYAQPSYIGADKCAKMCHKSEKKGKQYDIWRNSGHANSFKTLATPEAKKVAEKSEIKGDPQKADACLKCHVTAFGVDQKLLKPSYSIEEGIECETCHGPGSNYGKIQIMKDRNSALEKGMVIPDEELCKRCHNPNSPNYKEFKYEEMVKKIAHPKPENAGPEGK